MTDHLPSMLLKAPYDPAEVILIGGNIANNSMPQVADVTIDAGDENSGISLQLRHVPDSYEIALVQAYIFEGSYYELPKPKIMVVAGPGEMLPGQTAPVNSNLKYWRMNKLDRTTEISIEDGLLETLVLQANLPGRRSPNSYAANMQMAHKSGRLTS